MSNPNEDDTSLASVIAGLYQVSKYVLYPAYMWVESESKNTILISETFLNVSVLVITHQMLIRGYEFEAGVVFAFLVVGHIIGTYFMTHEECPF